jgi:sRNA-binding carbon storage regulator CsrA
MRVPPSTEWQEISVELIEAISGKARIGVTAERAVTVNRREIQQRIDAGVPIHTPSPVRVAEIREAMKGKK